MTLVRGQVFGRFGGNFEERVPSSAGYVVLYLRDQGRDEVEGLVNVGKLVEQLDHAVVVLESMQPDPGQPVLAADQVLVKRLMLVPQNYDAQNGHEREISKIEASSLAGIARGGRRYRSTWCCNLKPQSIVIPKRGVMARGICCFAAGRKQIPRR